MRQNIIVSVISLLLVSNLGVTGIFATEYQMYLPGELDPTVYHSIEEIATSVVQKTDTSYQALVDNRLSTVAPSSPEGKAIGAVKSADEGGPNNSGPSVVYVSEIIPGASCECQVGINKGTIGACGSDVNIAERKYACTINPGLSNFQLMFAGIIRYLINIVLLLGVLAIAALGVAWAWAAGDDAKAKSALKKWGTNIVAGLIILFLFQYILHFIAPWIYK